MLKAILINCRITEFISFFQWLYKKKLLVHGWSTPVSVFTVFALSYSKGRSSVPMYRHCANKTKCNANRASVLFTNLQCHIHSMWSIQIRCCWLKAPYGILMPQRCDSKQSKALQSLLLSTICWWEVQKDDGRS